MALVLQYQGLGDHASVFDADGNVIEVAGDIIVAEVPSSNKLCSGVTPGVSLGLLGAEVSLEHVVNITELPTQPKKLHSAVPVSAAPRPTETDVSSSGRVVESMQGVETPAVPATAPAASSTGGLSEGLKKFSFTEALVKGDSRYTVDFPKLAPKKIVPPKPQKQMLHGLITKKKRKAPVLTQMKPSESTASKVAIDTPPVSDVSGKKGHSPGASLMLPPDVRRSLRRKGDSSKDRSPIPKDLVLPEPRPLADEHKLPLPDDESCLDSD